MRLLLDTHAIYWYTTGDSKLSKDAQTAIQDATNDIFISPASLWEIAVKVSNGKWQMNQSFEVFLDRCLNQIHTALERLFNEEGQRIVFWNDPDQEFFMTVPQTRPRRRRESQLRQIRRPAGRVKSDLRNEG